MDAGVVGQAAGVFVVTNVDDIVLLALYFGRAVGRDAWRVVAGQYAGFTAILAISLLGALGAGLLPERFIPYLGLVPLLLGLRAAWESWRGGEDDEPSNSSPGVLAVAGVTLANGGDNIGVYVPVMAATGTAGLAVFTVVSLVLLAALCALGWYLASRAPVARALSRWGHIALPVVLIAIGVVVLTGVW